MNCPLCCGQEHVLFDQDRLREYFQCLQCSLVFVPRHSLLSSIDELKRYEAHENNQDDPGYRSYLNQIVIATTPFLSKKMKGLDFGCGKTKILAELFSKNGFAMDSYDVFFHPEDKIWNQQYDFIVASEVIEHLRRPIEVMRQLKDLLTPGGQIFIKTKLYPGDAQKFKEWFYKRDTTHVQFFDTQSLEYLAKQLNMKGAFGLECDDLFQFESIDVK
jgi:2-polyprenyl-3-methyl-5-hydroxy-6-metoxy-1,4-benzoquinol methylase